MDSYLGPISTYKPQGSPHLWVNRDAMTFDPDPAGSATRIDYLAFKDHHTAHLFNQATIQGMNESNAYGGSYSTAQIGLYLKVKQATEAVEEARSVERLAEDWAVVAESIRRVPLMAVVAGYGLHLLGLDLPVIGGPMSAAKWGLVTGLALQLGPIPAGAALIHTFVTNGRFIGPHGLFTRGIVVFGVSSATLYSTYWRTRVLLRQGWEARHVSRGHFEGLWTDIGKALRDRLDLAIQGREPKWQELQQQAQLLIDKKADIEQIYGGQATVYERHVVASAQRILEFDPTKQPAEIQAICQGEGEQFRTLEKRRDLLNEEIRTLQVPVDANKLAITQNARLEVEKDLKALGEWDQKIRQAADALFDAMAQLQVGLVKPDSAANGPITYANNIYDLYTAFIAREKQQDPNLSRCPHLLPLHESLDRACQSYEGYNPAKEELEEALAIATLCQHNQEMWRFGKDASETKRWEGADTKLADVKSGRLRPREFIHWVKERARIEKDLVAKKQDPYPPHLAAYAAYDTYRYIKASSASS